MKDEPTVTVVPEPVCSLNAEDVHAALVNQAVQRSINMYEEQINKSTPDNAEAHVCWEKLHEITRDHRHHVEVMEKVALAFETKGFLVSRSTISVVTINKQKRAQTCPYMIITIKW
jgi:hypothetical protein